MRDKDVRGARDAEEEVVHAGAGLGGVTEFVISDHQYFEIKLSEATKGSISHVGV